MKKIEVLYERLSKMSHDDFYEIEAEFCYEFYEHMEETEKPLCIVAFLTIASWFAASVRSGVWTFYEVADQDDIELTLQFLEESGNAELATIFRYGVHDYQNPVYAENGDYPNEWMEEADKIDEWIEEHENWLYDWERNLLMENQDLICSLQFKENF